MSNVISPLQTLKKDPDVVTLVQLLTDKINQANTSPSFVHLWILRYRIRMVYSELDDLLQAKYGITAKEAEVYVAIPKPVQQT